MKKARIQKNAPNPADRLLFFDILRIGCVALIYYNHFDIPLLASINSIFFSDGYFFFNIYPRSLGVIAIYGMFFVSGAVLAYNYKKIIGFSGYVRFLYKRFVRLYPAFWMSLLLGILLVPAVLNQNILTLFLEFTGFFIFLGTGPGAINQMGWFIGAVFALYLLFPVLYRIIEKYGIPALIGMLIISYASRSLLITFNPLPAMSDVWLWLPVCNLFEFCLGIYLIKNKLYPGWRNESPLIRQLSELSFYVFLFHVIIIHAVLNYVYTTVSPTVAGPAFGVTVYVSTFVLVLCVSWIAMIIDRRIQKRLLAVDITGFFDILKRQPA
jgi:peptidoglycan/LPS O-acetylase OafA/YrhL